jgi:lysine decarboxylase
VVAISKRDVPIYNALMKYSASGPTPFHMPGHKLGKGIPGEFLKNLALLDITEIPGADNLHNPEGIIKEAQGRAAGAFGADETFFLVNGSTCGIHAMIMTACKPGDSLIVSRDCHKSVIAGMMLAGVRPVYLMPAYDRRFGIPTCVNPEKLKEALEENRDAAGVLITRPNYYGICSNIEETARIVHAHGKLLMVDEAHGAHLCFSSRLPVSALEGGADMCVQSAHKTLPAFTQGAYLHVKSGLADRERLRFFLRLLQTSSPSYVIMSLLDIARDIMEHDGEKLLDGVLDNIGLMKRRLDGLHGLEFLKSGKGDDWEQDDTRITINVAKLGITGFEAGNELRARHNIQVEMSDLYNIVLIATVADGSESFAKLEKGLDELAAIFKGGTASTDIIMEDLDIPVQGIDLRDMISRKGVRVGLDSAIGRVCMDIITPYPPGVPVICPGEVITREIADYIRRVMNEGGVIQGIGKNFDIEVASDMI